jgi:hypothetical protein
MLMSKQPNQLSHWCRHNVALLVCMLTCLICNSANVYAEETYLQIKPANCVALREGQACYQTLTINWQAPAVDSYCLYEQGNATALICWSNLMQGSGIYEFAGKKSADFILVRKRDAQTLAKFTLEVAWVYDANSHRESHWRIF